MKWRSSSMVVVWIAALALAGGMAGCSADASSGGPRARGDGPGGKTDDPGEGPGGGPGPVEGCQPEDTDGDGIADDIEGDGDVDADGIPNDMDLDSDGDGIPDADEWLSDNPCSPTDSDGDSSYDPYDTDSDDDGLPDSRERELGTDPTKVDSDGDGVSDLGEVEGSETDPNDPTSTIPEGDFFVVLPHMGDHEMRKLRFGTDIEIADVFFLVDMTGSMQGERTNLINGLLDVIIPGIQAEIPNVQFGAGGFDDFPTGSYGGDRDLPFYLLREIGPGEQDVGAWSMSAGPSSCPSGGPNDVGRIMGGANGRPDILEAVEGLPCHNGGDGPESYVPALWSTATGGGLSWPGGDVPGQSCPTIPDEPGMRRGYPCFRPGALPIVLLFGDAPFHNGPMNASPYEGFTAPKYDETVTALNELGARVVGIFSGGSVSIPIPIPGLPMLPGGSAEHYEAIARDTGAVRSDGSPLVFEINGNGSGLDATVVDAVAELVGGTPQDVSTRQENVPGNPDEFDATQFMKSITPVEGYRSGVAGDGYGSKDATTFYGVIPGTVVEFEIDFHNDVRPPADVAQIFEARIIVVGNGVADLDARNVYIVVPPEEGIVFF